MAKDRAFPRFLDLASLPDEYVIPSHLKPATTWFDRLQPYGQLIESPQVTLQIRRINAGHYRLVGQMQADLSLQCQRCLDDFKQAVDRKLLFETVLSKQQAEAVEAPFEAIIFETSDQELDLIGLLEDELLLEIPLVPKHADLKDCNQDMLKRAKEYVAEQEKPVQSKKNPFAVLEGFKVDMNTKKPDDSEAEN